MDATLATIRQLAATASDATRRQLVSSLNRVILSFESPNDTVHRYGHMMSLAMFLKHSTGAKAVRRIWRPLLSTPASSLDCSSVLLKLEVR
jgi:hypothetical protein